MSNLFFIFSLDGQFRHERLVGDFVIWIIGAMDNAFYKKKVMLEVPFTCILYGENASLSQSTS